MVEKGDGTNMNPGKQKCSEQNRLERMPEGWEDEVFKIDDTPENVAKALFQVNPNEEGFEWEYLNPDNHKAKEPTRTDNAVQ